MLAGSRSGQTWCDCCAAVTVWLPVHDSFCQPLGITVTSAGSVCLGDSSWAPECALNLSACLMPAVWNLDMHDRRDICNSTHTTDRMQPSRSGDYDGLPSEPRPMTCSCIVAGPDVCCPVCKGATMAPAVVENGGAIDGYGAPVTRKAPTSIWQLLKERRNQKVSYALSP